MKPYTEAHQSLKHLLDERNIESAIRTIYLRYIWYLCEKGEQRAEEYLVSVGKQSEVRTDSQVIQDLTKIVRE